jgi:hypothetical protein
MNEKAIQDAYNLFAESGYRKSIDDFKSLIKTNPNALNDSYELFKGKGYNKDIESYKSLVGVSEPEKKIQFLLGQHLKRYQLRNHNRKQLHWLEKTRRSRSLRLLQVGKNQNQKVKILILEVAS